MSRSGYDDGDGDMWGLVRWRGAVASAIRGQRGQAFLLELLAALDAMPEKRLIAHSFAEQGAYCTLGVIGAARGVDMPKVAPEYGAPGIDPEDSETIRRLAREALGIPDAMAAEVMFLNDEGWYGETPEQRWKRMRAWVAEQIKAPAEGGVRS